MKWIFSLTFLLFSGQVMANDKCNLADHFYNKALSEMELVKNKGTANTGLSKENLCSSFGKIQALAQTATSFKMQCRNLSTSDREALASYHNEVLGGKALSQICFEKLDGYELSREMHFIISDFKILF